MTHSPPPSSSDEAHRTGIRQLVKDILSVDRRAITILVSVPILLTILEYYGLPWHYSRFVQRDASTQVVRTPPFAEFLGSLSLGIGPPALRPYLWWGIACVLLLILAPLVLGRLVGASPRALGIRLKGTRRDAPTYLLLYVIFLPVIYWVSTRADFQKTYPFFKQYQDLGGDFLAFQAVYCLQFLGIELFFRGYIVLGLKPYLGKASVLVMLAPYCMIHYYKPMPEAMGAIGAGLVLGFLAWRSGTVLYGWALHYAVALSMDLLALKHLDLL